MLTIRKSSKHNAKATEDISSQKKLYDTKKLKKVKTGALKTQTATDKKEIVFRKRNQDKDLNLVEVRVSPFIQQSSKSIMISLLQKYYNQLIIKQKQKAISKQQKINLVAKILPIIMPKIKKICYKHDGSRMIEACLKYGSVQQRNQISKSLQSQFYELSCGKYSTHLAKRLVISAEKDDKAQLSRIAQNKVKKFINDIVSKCMNSCQVLDEIYNQSNGEVQKKLRHSIFGEQFVLFSATKGNKDDDDQKQLKQFTENNPDAIQSYQNLLSKLVQKALVTHGIVQDVMLQFVKLAPVEVNRTFLNESNLKVSFPSLLSSRNGVTVACYFYTISDAKQRKQLIKLIKQGLKDYILNKIDCIFILKIILSTDDTVLVKRSIIQKILQIADSSITLAVFQKVIGTLFSQGSNEQGQKYGLLTKEQKWTLSFGQQFSTSKKNMKQRIAEILDQNTYSVISKTILNHLSQLLQSESYIFIGSFVKFSIQNQQREYCKTQVVKCFSSLQQYFTQIFEAIGGNSIVPVLSDPGGHRFMKLLVNLQVQIKQGEQMLIKLIWSKMKGSFLDYAKTKAVFILIALIQSKCFVSKEVIKSGMKNKEKIMKEAKNLQQKGVKNSGVSILLNLLK